MSRVLVVGGGVAGCMAAVAAAREGAEVTLVWRAPGATALYAGAMELTAGLNGLPAHHPLARLGMDPLRLGAELDDAAAALVAGLRGAGLELAGSWRSPGLYADIHGRPRRAALVPATVAGGELSALRGRRVAVVGFEPVSEYAAETTAEALRELCGLDAFAHPVRVAGLPPGASLADLQGRPAPALGRVRAEAIALPPGLRGLPDRAFELLATVPSPHGLALHTALHAMVEGAGVRVVRAQVSGFAGEPGRIEAALVAGERLEGDRFVLATGRFIGGGLRRDHGLDEPVLGLEVFAAGRPARHHSRLAHLEYLDPAPALAAGLMTDEQLRPLAATGRPAYENLRAAGALLGGWDEAGPEGFGVPLLTGWLAGRWSA